MSNTTIDTYQPNLSAGQLDSALSSIVRTQRRCEWLLCRYLADMAEDRAFQKVGWYADVFHYTQERFGLSMKVTRERVRIGRALRSLPCIEKAFVDRSLSYSRVRELTRVATAEDENDWLRQARILPMRELEQRVAGRVGGVVVADAPAQERWRSAETVDVTLHLPADGWALLRRAMQAARHESEGSLTDAQALEAVANQALASLCQPDATSAADPRQAVVLYQCRQCGKTELETGAGAVPLLPAQAERSTHQQNAPTGACAGATRAEAVAGPIDAPIGGSTQALLQEPSTPKRFEGSDEAQKVLHAMGSRDRWHPEHLLKPTGLDFRSVTCALFELTMADAVREGPLGYYWAAC